MITREEATHWRQMNPDQKHLGAWAVSEGKELILTIRDIKIEEVIGQKGMKSDKLVCYFMEDVKPMVLNATNATTIEEIYHTSNPNNWIGKKIQLYGVKIKAGQFGIRIREFVPHEMIQHFCEECGQEVQPTTKMTVEGIVQFAKAKYGRTLCADCMRKLTEAKNGTEKAE